ncbi:hypothetical protein OIU34_08565 [Pararhizobium sp. BT-229]|uniref:hypothetical protein n=1 Tax=Pararhizobium sp. BT-229 TaxID=2986923 RepID=UPI0021F71267|nr:hypothetical protein [Pararhizobium sp. BT-229]MCV9961953.1 hypothetical protein [Pararhizobium sp. BT-229]
MYVADEDLLEIFGVDDIAEARRRFIRLLPPKSNLKDFLTGDLPPTRARVASYLRLLMFLCWMQTTKTRMEGDRQFHEMFEHHLDFRPWSMNGLNGLWEHLRDHLRQTYDIDLDLPDITPYVQIGRTLRIAFPTWRDKHALIKVRELMAPSALLDPLAVASKLRTSGGVDGERNPSLKYNFEIFDSSRKRGGDEYIETAFWQAWYSVVSENTPFDTLEVAPGEFGEYELFRATPLGEKTPVRVPEQVTDFVPNAVAKAIRNGEVPMEDAGFGRARSLIAAETNLFLVRRDKLDRVKLDELVQSRPVDARWTLVLFRNRVRPELLRKTTAREFGWRGGIRVGGAMLGRAPYAPILGSPLDGQTRVTVNGSRIDMVAAEDGLRFPPGDHAGQVVGLRGNEARNVRLAAHAVEFGEARRLSYDPARDVSEDQFYQNTVPASVASFIPWSGERVAPSGHLVDIGEALYAKTARGLSFIDALEIIRRGLDGVADAPRDWDVLRSFTDAGWFDLTLLRRFPARRVLQRRLSAEAKNGETILITGPAPIAVLERLEETAKASGARLESVHGGSMWSLPRHLVRSPHRAAQLEFMQRVKLSAPDPTVQAKVSHGDAGGVHGYRVNARFDEDRGFFRPQEDQAMTEGLYRLEHIEGKSPILYRSMVAKRHAENFEASSIAILSHHARHGRQLFSYDGRLLRGAAARAALPASWARWASDRNICNAGPQLLMGKWEYLYPISEAEVGPLSALVSIVRKDTSAPTWVDSFTASASNKGRFVYDPQAQKIRSGNSLSGKRYQWQ